VADEVVVDASVMLRGLSPTHTTPDTVISIAEGSVVGHAPDLIVVEVANALATGARAGVQSVAEAGAAFELFASYPIELHRSGTFALEAIERAVADSLSVYDALYAAVARALDVPLVTADRRVADSVPGAVLVA
jgi:predicted nucleic acid-binding protein